MRGEGYEISEIHKSGHSQISMYSLVWTELQQGAVVRVLAYEAVERIDS